MVDLIIFFYIHFFLNINSLVIKINDVKKQDTYYVYHGYVTTVKYLFTVDKRYTKTGVKLT